MAPDAGPLAGLGAREREVLWHVAQGMSRQECAQTCGISGHTVAEDVRFAYRKPGVNDRAAAARLVIARAP